MASEIIFEVVESAEGGFEARSLQAPIFTQAETIEQLRDAVRCHFDSDEAPSIIRLHMVRDEVFAA